MTAMLTLEAPAVEPIRKLQSELRAGHEISHGNVRAVSAEDAERVRAKAQAFLALANLTRASIARAIEVAPSAMSSFLSNRYAGDWRKIAWRLDRYMADELSRRQSPRRRSARAFVETRIASDVFVVAEAVKHLGGIGLIYGPSGLGKTCAMEELSQRDGGQSVLVRLETLSSTAAGVFEAIARSLDLIPSSRAYMNARAALHMAKRRLLERPTFLMLDEMHKLMGQGGDKALHALRDLHDATRTPMLWCATTDLVAYLESEQAKGQHREPLAQTRRRIVVSRDLTADADRRPIFSRDEVRSVFAHFDLEDQAVADLAELANVPNAGHLGACRTVVSMAAKLRGNSCPLSREIIRDALSLLVNRRASRHLAEMDSAGAQRHWRPNEPQSDSTRRHMAAR